MTKSSPCAVTPAITAEFTASTAYCRRTIIGSWRRSFTSATASPIITSTKGRAATMVMVCKPVSASEPPASNITADTAPVATPQKMTVLRCGSMVPRSDSEPITMDAASAPETKNTATSTITTTVDTVASGYSPSRPNSCPSTVPSPAGSAPSCWALIAAPPNTQNQTNETRLGTIRTPVTNCRMVRPREIRAMNMPTNGVQEIHHAQ